MHLKSRSGGGQQDMRSSKLKAPLEEGLPFWHRECASVKGVKRLEMKERV